MAKTNSNFRLSKTTKRMMALMKGTTEQRNQYKNMMIDAEHCASIVIKPTKKEKFVTGTPATE
jgi:hypothetical protein